jgi:predicted RNA-binding protein YlqC (UPF0109 family)
MEAINIKIKDTRQRLVVDWGTTKLFQRKRDTFIFDIGDMALLSQWKKKAEELGKLFEGFKQPDTIGIEKVQEGEEKILSLVFDKKTVDYIFQRSGNNILAIKQILQELTGLMERAFAEIKEDV